jgi:hypothetical protein
MAPQPFAYLPLLAALLLIVTPSAGFVQPAAAPAPLRAPTLAGVCGAAFPQPAPGHRLASVRRCTRSDGEPPVSGPSGALAPLERLLSTNQSLERSIARAVWTFVVSPLATVLAGAHSGLPASAQRSQA